MNESGGIFRKDMQFVSLEYPEGKNKHYRVKPIYMT